MPTCEHHIDRNRTQSIAGGSSTIYRRLDPIGMSPHRSVDVLLVPEEQFFERIISEKRCRDLDVAELRARIPREFFHRTPDGLSVDMNAAESWLLRNHSPSLENWLRLGNERTEFVLSATRAERGARYRLRHATRFQLKDGSSKAHLRCSVPYPKATSHQRITRLVSGNPGLHRHLDAQLGSILDFPLTASKNGRYELEYEVEVDVAEIRSHDLESLSWPCQESANPGAQWLAVPPICRSQAERVISSVVTSDSRKTPLAGLRQLYQYVLEARPFSFVRQCTCLQCVGQDLSKRVDSNCYFAAASFVMLARAYGVPARLAAGQMLGLPVEEGAGRRTSIPGLRPSHFWAEVFEGTHGWLPIEFHSIVYRSPVVNTLSVPNAEKRTECTEIASAFEDYYFGSLDNLRFQCSPGPFGVWLSLEDGQRQVAVVAKTEVLVHQLPTPRRDD